MNVTLSLFQFHADLKVNVNVLHILQGGEKKKIERRKKKGERGVAGGGRGNVYGLWWQNIYIYVEERIDMNSNPK